MLKCTKGYGALEAWKKLLEAYYMSVCTGSVLMINMRII